MPRGRQAAELIYSVRPRVLLKYLVQPLVVVAAVMVVPLVVSATGTVSELELPHGAKAVCYYRDNTFALVDEDTAIKKGDEVVILPHSEHLPELRERWAP